MSHLSPIKARDLLKILKKLGFVQIRQKGSHIFIAGPKGKTTVVPNHPSKQIGIGLLRSILHDLEISSGKFEKLKRK